MTESEQFGIELRHAGWNELQHYCEEKIHDIQNGEYQGRYNFPETMRGEIAKDLWNDPKFSYGMEYGCLQAMVEIQRKLGVRDD